ncbi:hypothetical protein L227DRAFT_507060 [Lentinus tigrinus ALCF2SS1-6]|uniref:Fungal-type protein kinase domain-containing protein n=1 Tax=Lentinus tigrinus ALCF2SS1-6 TaxID=1328759 RepID=A0A5C2S1A2_9APHY|nr:hypothetical protein L227DRAFT_507060 [Lentinus tigrinus ALCF2SS1-6]
MADDDLFSVSTAIGEPDAADHCTPPQYSLPSPPYPTTSIPFTFFGETPTTTDSTSPPQPPNAPETTNTESAGIQWSATPIKHQPNSSLVAPPTGKERNLDLIGRAGMGPRWCEMPVDVFLSKVRGELPTEEERKLFKGADLSGVKLEKDIYPILTTTIHSVFTAAHAQRVRVLETPTRRADDGHRTRTDTLNDAGIYLNIAEAVKVTTIKEQKKKSRRKGARKDAKKSTGEDAEKTTDGDAEKTTDGDAQKTTDGDAEKTTGGDADANAAEPSHVGLRSWHWVAVPIEVKHNHEHAAFRFIKAPSAAGSDTQKEPSAKASSSAGPSNTSSKKHFIRNTINNQEGLGQFVEYMMNVFDNQHRIFSYAIYVWDYMARLCFFDRGGGVISEEFSWTTPDSPLHDFVWKVAHMSEAQLGYDTTVQRVSNDDSVSDDDKKAVDEFKGMTNNSNVHEMIRSFVEDATREGQPIYKVHIIPMAAPPDEGFPDDPFPKPPPADESSSAPSPTPSPSTPPSPSPPPAPLKPRSFLIGKPYFSSHSLIGRCTRGYIAYDVHGKRLCFLKDYWRPYVPNRTRPEHLVYERMARCGVEGIPTLICGGDVGGTRAQMTQIQDLLYHLGHALPVPRSHYRMATVEIGLPLESFTNFKQLALVFADAVFAHFQAWTKAKVLHRDISIGNILIDPTKLMGLLIDWDLCRLECELESGPTEPDRTGTFQFRSALAACFPRKPYRLSDDIESFIHAFHYLVLKYHPIEQNGLRQLVESMYESHSFVQGIKVGDESKLRFFLNSLPPFNVCANDVLQSILNDLHKGCYESYRDVDVDEMRTLYRVSDPGVAEEPRPLSVDVPVNTARTERLLAAFKQSDNAPTSTSTNRRRTTRSTTKADATASATPTDRLSGFLSNHGPLLEVLTSYEYEEGLDDKKDNQFEVRAKENPLPVPYRPVNYHIGSLSTPSTENDLHPVLGHRRLGTPSSLRSFSSFSQSSDIVGPIPGDKRPFDDGDAINLSFPGSEDVNPPPDEPPRAEKRKR